MYVCLSSFLEEKCRASGFFVLKIWFRKKNLRSVQIVDANIYESRF